MTEDSKVEPRLQAEIERVRATGDPNQPIPVIIQLWPAGATPTDATKDLGEMERSVAAQQRGVFARLAELGVTEAHSSVLSNSVNTRLTAGHIVEIAQRSDVKRVVWNREDFVAV